MPEETPSPCHCGNTEPVLDVDELTEGAFIECTECGRTCGALTTAEALQMWRAAMAGLAGSGE